jgi:glycosyltransferase involved in cell wall biosynthesis
MKVLHVTPSVSPIHGGTTAAILGMVKALKNQGISVEILTTNDDGQKVLDVPIQKKVIYNGVPCIFCNCLPYLPRYAISNDLAQWLWQQITNYDLIHIHCVFSYSSTVAMTIARIQQKQFIVTPHGMLCDWSLRQHSRLKKAYLQMIGYDNLNRARIIHFTADQERLEAQVLSLKTESTTIPLGLDIPMIIPDASVRVRKLLGISDNAPLILFLSRIHPKKGLDYLIRALAKISSQFPFHLIIAGDGTEEDKQIIYELIDDFQLKDKTHFLGFVQGENKNLLLQGSSLFALTSHSENFGIVVIEAMAAGLPILVTPGVALSNVIRDNDFGYVPDLDADDIAKDIQRFLTAEYTTENKSINERSKNYIKDNYSWNTISKKMINVYQQILN